MPAQDKHRAFETPADINIKLWRYMDFTKFVSLLDTGGLYFSRSDMLGDPYEGSAAHYNKAMWPLVYKGDTVSAMQWWSVYYEWLRQWTLVNCWHMNEVESAAMWSLYAKTNEAVAIQTTYKILSDALPNNVFVGVVKYIDYDTEWLPEGNILFPYFHKRRSFAHERELRAVIQEYPPTIDVNGKNIELKEISNSDAGTFIPIDISTVVQNIFLAPTCPDWFRKLVENVVAKYGYSVSVARSALDKPPTF